MTTIPPSTGSAAVKERPRAGARLVTRWARTGRPAWSLPGLAGVVILTAFLYTWELQRGGMGNTFCAAAVKSGTESWKAFFFGSLDPGSFITVDKPPASLWVMELSSRIFGFSSWSMLLPQALAGIAAVLMLYRLVRRWHGEAAAIMASLAFALTPVATVMFRLNNPDAFLTFLLVAAAWAFWSALETARTSRLVLCAALLGFAFLTKSLQAFVVLPAFGVAYLASGLPRLARRLVQLLWAGLALLISSGWWVAVVEIWPASSRPYIGGSTDNSELDLIFGYNGFGRLLGSATGSTPSDSSFGGGPGLLRMFGTEIGGQVAWLIPLALAGLGAGLWAARGRRRADLGRAGYTFWGGSAISTMILFSETRASSTPTTRWPSRLPSPRSPAAASQRCGASGADHDGGHWCCRGQCSEARYGRPRSWAAPPPTTQDYQQQSSSWERSRPQASPSCSTVPAEHRWRPYRPWSPPPRSSPGRRHTR